MRFYVRKHFNIKNRKKKNKETMSNFIVKTGNKKLGKLTPRGVTQHELQQSFFDALGCL